MADSRKDREREGRVLERAVVLVTGSSMVSPDIWRNAFADVVTLPQLFKNNGYFTQGMGKVYHPGYDDEPSWSTPWTGPKGVIQYGSAEAQDIVKKAREKLMKHGRLLEQK